MIDGEQDAQVDNIIMEIGCWVDDCLKDFFGTRELDLLAGELLSPQPEWT